MNQGCFCPATIANPAKIKNFAICHIAAAVDIGCFCFVTFGETFKGLLISFDFDFNIPS